MKIVNVIGGLGNQMFQYCFFLYLKFQHIDAKLDTTSFANFYSHNGIELNRVFGLLSEEEIASASLLKEYKDSQPLFKFRKVIGKFLLGNSNALISSSHWVEPCYSRHYCIENLQNKIYLDGYWQNENYFINMQDEIRKIYTWKSIDYKNAQVVVAMKQENSVSIHIRRPDKIRNLKHIFYHLRLYVLWRRTPSKYYIDAINLIENKVQNPHFYIFTNNLTWIEKHIKKIHPNSTIVDWNSGEQSHMDMYLMTQCKHNIIDMSTFSWWGAWLNNNPNKVVIAPMKWAPRYERNNLLIPKTWIKL